MKLTKNQKEAFEAVDKINQELYNKYKKLDDDDLYKDWLCLQPLLSITFADDMVLINLSIPSFIELSLPEINIYCSEQDDRIYYEKSDKYENFYPYIKRKFREIKEEIYSIKL